MLCISSVYFAVCKLCTNYALVVCKLCARYARFAGQTFHTTGVHVLCNLHAIRSICTVHCLQVVCRQGARFCQSACSP